MSIRNKLLFNSFMKKTKQKKCKNCKYAYIWNGNRISSVKSNFNEEDIDTIVTKEMMESISYKV